MIVVEGSLFFCPKSGMIRLRSDIFITHLRGICQLHFNLSKMRRCALSTELNRLGISKIALGHHPAYWKNRRVCCPLFTGSKPFSCLYNFLPHFSNFCRSLQLLTLVFHRALSANMRNRNVTICFLVQVISGLNVLAVVPELMPLLTAHWTGAA